MNYKNNKGGRPKSNPSEIRNRKVTVRFTEDEYKFLNKFGENKSDVIRVVFIKTFKKKNITINTNKDPRFVFAINKIGVNINQITKKYNETGNPSNLDIDKLYFYLNYLITILNGDLKQ